MPPCPLIVIVISPRRRRGRRHTPVLSLTMIAAQRIAQSDDQSCIQAELGDRRIVIVSVVAFAELAKEIPRTLIGRSTGKQPRADPQTQPRGEINIGTSLQS